MRGIRWRSLDKIPTVLSISKPTLLCCRLAFGGGGAGQVRCGGKGGATPFPLVVTLSTFGADPPPLPAIADPLPMWCFNCSLSTLTLFAEAAEFKVFVVGVLRGICGKFWLETLRNGGGGGLFGGGRGGGATVGRPEGQLYGDYTVPFLINRMCTLYTYRLAFHWLVAQHWSWSPLVTGTGTMVVHALSQSGFARDRQVHPESAVPQVVI